MGRNGKPSKARYYGSARAYTSGNKPVGGPGIYVTCNRGKEARCVAEAYDLLDQAIEALCTIKVQSVSVGPSATQGTQNSGDSNETDNHQEEEPNKTPPEFEFIEDAIVRELQSLSVHGTKQHAQKASSSQSHRALSVKTNTDCLIFMSIAPAYDPVAIAHWIVQSALERNSPAARHVLRLEPVTATCHALTQSEVEATSFDVVKAAFAQYVHAKNVNALSYAIEPSIRNHVEPLSRQAVIELAGASIRKLPDLGDFEGVDIRANLASPDLVVLPTVLRNCYGISVVDGALWTSPRSKKFNMSVISAPATRQI